MGGEKVRNSKINSRSAGPEFENHRRHEPGAIDPAGPKKTQRPARISRSRDLRGIARAVERDTPKEGRRNSSIACARAVPAAAGKIAAEGRG